MLLGLETFSYHYAFGIKKMDVFGFINRAHELGLDGVQINVGNGPSINWNQLGGNDPDHLRKIRELLDKFGMYVELDTRGTDPEHMTRVLNVCKALGADAVSYTHLTLPTN